MEKKDKILEATPSLAKQFSFRLGSTSYVIPANLETNVSSLVGLVDDIEVVLFESEEFSNLPSKRVVEKMAALRQEHETSYTIHFPLDISITSVDLKEQEKSIAQCIKIIELMAEVEPFAYILHLDNPPLDLNNKIETVAWQKRSSRAIKNLLKTGIKSTSLCIETLCYPFEVAFPIVKELNLSICLDIGHVLLNNYDLKNYYQKYFDISRVIHLHGIIDKKDHCNLSNLEHNIIDDLVNKLNNSKKKRVLTMEVFGRDDFFSSLKTMEKYKKCPH